MLQSVSPGNADSWNPANSPSPIQWHGHAHGHGDAIGDETGSDTFPEPLSDMSWLPSRTVTVTASPPLLLNPFNSPLNPYQDEDHANGNDRHCEYERKFNSNSEQVSQIETLTLSPNESPILATGVSDSSISSLHSLSSSPSEFHSSSDLSILNQALASEAEGEILGAAGGLSVSPSVGSGTDGSVSGESESDGNLNGSGHGSAKSTHRHSKSSVRRLAAQMKYDKKRRVVQKVAFESLREGLQLAHMECQRVRQEAADLLQEESQDDQSDSNTTSLKEWETLAIQLQEGQRVTTIDLFRGAAEAISGLRRLKRALESKVQQLDSSQQVAQLLDNIQVVHKKYRAEMDAVRNIEISKQYLPRSLTDVSRIFEDMVVFTMDGTFIRAAPAPATAPAPASGSNFARSSSPSELDQVDSENRILSSVYHLGRFSGRWGSAIIHQMHAIVSYCSNGAFLKQMRSQSQLKLSADNNRRELTTANVVQMLRDSADVSLSLSQPSQSSSSSSSSSSSASSSSLGGNDCPSAFSAYPSLESDLLRHPLGSCSCPPSCLYTFLQVVSSWLAWSEEEYYAQMDVIRDLAKSASTDDYVDSKVVWQEEFHAKGYSPKDMVFHPLSAAPYEWIPALYGLFSGQKSVITIPCFTRLKHAVVPIDMTIFCVKEPNTGMPLTLVYLLHSIRLDRPANFLVEEAAALERVRKNVANYNEKQSQMKWPC